MNATTNMKTASTGSLLATIIGDPLTAYHVEKVLAESSRLPTTEELKRIKGIGQATAEKVLAVCELSARYIVGTERRSVTSPEDLLGRLAHLKYAETEHFVCVTLDATNHIINVHEITKGLVNQTPVHPREAFKLAILDNAVSVIFAHNHPSGSTEASCEDIAITRVLCSAGKILEIPVLDHMIISKAGYNSICRQQPEIFERTFNTNREPYSL